MPMLEPKHADAWCQSCNIFLLVFVVSFCDDIIYLALVILSPFDGQIHAKTFPLNGWCTSPDPERKEEMTSTAHPLTVNTGSRYPYYAPCFVDVSIDGWKPFQGLFATMRKWLWTHGFWCFCSSPVTFCPLELRRLFYPHGSGRRQNLLSHLVSPLQCRYRDLDRLY